MVTWAWFVGGILQSAIAYWQIQSGKTNEAWIGIWLFSISAFFRYIDVVKKNNELEKVSAQLDAIKESYKIFGREVYETSRN